MFDRTREALEEYTVSEAARTAASEAVTTKDDVRACIAANWFALEQVREAFYEDTKAYNTREDCALVSIAFMRRMAGRK